MDQNSVFASEAPSLFTTHFQQLHEDSGIAAEIILERGYRSILGTKELADLGFSKAQRRIPGILVPLHAPDSSPAGYQYRPDNPRQRQNKPVKYENPSNASIRIDMPLRCQPNAGNPAVPLWITEGAKKADALASHGLCSVNLSGVWGFKGKNPLGGVVVLADLDNIAVNGREVNIAYDSDIIDKPGVRQALDRLAEHLHRREAQVFLAVLPQSSTGGKVGVDDYLIDHNLDDLLALRQIYMPSTIEHRYECREDGLGYYNDDGAWLPVIPVPTAIVALEIDAAGEAPSSYTLMAQINGQNNILRLTSDQLADARALRAAFLGFGVALSPRREHLVATALLATSGDLTKITIHRRIGWEKNIYIAPGREPQGIRVDLPQNVFVALSGSKLDTAQKSLKAFLDAFPLTQTTIIAAHAFLAPLARPADLYRYKYGLHLTGRTGALKTSMACAITALWAGEDWERQPVLKWGEGATNNAIITHATHLADAPILIDNYKQGTGGGPKSFVALLHNILEGGERERLTRQSVLRRSKELHAWPLTTGEDIPQQDAASMARLLVLRLVWPDGRANHRLSACQASAHHLPALLRCWLSWIEENMALVKTLGQTVTDRREKWATWLRDRYPGTVNSLRLATNLSLQEITWDAMLRCPELAAVIAPYSAGHQAGLEVLAGDMSQVTTGALEAGIWLVAFSNILSGGRLYLRSVRGEMTAYGGGDRYGQHAGWYDEDFAYILPTVAHGEIFEALRRGGQPLAVSIPTLYKQLEDLGVIARQGQDGKTLVAKTIEGRTHKVLQLFLTALESKADDDWVDL